MRIISFCKKWDKLNQPEFTTFRFPRKDKDWYVGEIVQVYFKNRSPQREKLGVAEIISKEKRNIATNWGEDEEAPMVSNEEAIADGFENWGAMLDGLLTMHPVARLAHKTMNKLTLTWIKE